ncbi:four helix bundle protein [Candidatus Uhrbacteria bacterium]|nr:four helix bundle protein [Candidatus Uhrbacteria bacterium]
MHEFTKKFPKGDKYSLGEKIKSVILEILELFMEAESAKRDWKEQALERANRKLGIAKVLIRLSHDIHILDDKKYLSLTERLLEIGRMTGGWMKAMR